MSSPMKEEDSNNDPRTRPLRRGDLVRVSPEGMQAAKRLKDRAGQLGRVIQHYEQQEQQSEEEEEYFDVEWVMGGRTPHCRRTELLWTCAEIEGMTTKQTHREKRKPTDFMAESTTTTDRKKSVPKKRKLTAAQSQQPSSVQSSSSSKKTAPKAPPPKAKATKQRRTLTEKPMVKSKSKVKAAASPVPADPSTSAIAASIQTGADLYEKHRREFERIFLRLRTKIDVFRHFWTVEKEPPPQPNESLDTATLSAPTVDPLWLPPDNWESIQRRMNDGRYVLDRVQKEKKERQRLLQPYYSYLSTEGRKKRPKSNPQRVVCPKGVHWEVFRTDVFAMCDAALERRRRQVQPTTTAPRLLDGSHTEENEDAPETAHDDDDDDDQGQRGSLSYTVKKIREAVQTAVERTGHRHEQEMAFLDDRCKFGLAMESTKNTEAAMQSWRKVPFPERKYERLSADVVCSGLSNVDEKIAAFELKTKLPDSFIGQSYRYDDTGQSEAWMKSVVDETGFNHRRAKATKKAPAGAEEQLAALALAADEGVVRAQVSATMQSLLIAIQDRVMTECGVLRQPELRSANWIDEHVVVAEEESDTIIHPNDTLLGDNVPKDAELLPEIVEQPVWGIDCYTRGNILNCLNIEFDPQTSLLFVEKWLLPAINACPESLAHNISNAARILEGLPLDNDGVEDVLEGADGAKPISAATKAWSESLLGRALLQKIAASAPPWLPAAANQLRRAHASLGPDFFRVHPKGHGSVVLSSSLKANALVTFYRGELYPSWRWGEKMDAIDITQSRKDLKPALPDFYNMALERPQTDPRGYGLLFVDASRKAGHGSSLSHSCAPTCEVRVAACDGELCIAMTTLRELEMGEELTFDYNAVTESLNEYRSAVCLCGYGKCRGSFLHFATADCYQQVLNRNAPIASRFASLIKGSMKQVMSPDDEQILRNHGFLTASFGAISVNRHDTSSDGEELVDSLDMVPIWLRTYVADTLRYIEYERRALPIALICEHLAATKKEDPKLSVTLKEPKPLATFFYFSTTQSDFIRELMNKEGFPESLSGLQLRHAMQKVAANHWSSLSDEEKKVWKDKAQLDYEKKMKEWRSASKQISVDEKKRNRSNKAKIEIDEILHRSKMSFQDADAEGVAAMEQRIQQLTQTLSRVGRVLDRHREETFESDPGVADAESMRKRVHCPLRVLSDKEVVDWMWNSEDGVVLPLLREVEGSRFVRPCFLASLRDVRREFSSLETKDEVVGERRQLKIALLQLRGVICQELKEMTKEFRQLRAQPTLPQVEDPNNHDAVVSSDSESEENIPPLSELGESNTFENVDTLEPATLPSKNTIDFLCKDVNAVSADGIDVPKADQVNQESHQWLDFYAERFVLHAAADLLLMYAHTSNFFVIEQYRPLESTPVEVYARELGNEVPISAIDVYLSTKSIDTDKKSIPRCKEDHIRPLEGAVDIPSSDTDIVSEVKRQSSELCAPDDIVAKVTVRYDGDYIASQLLQWYNAGIGQKPGLPDLLGCTLLPRIADCWSSELLKKSKLKADRRTTYESKIRPKLVEWLQDPYQRGSAWPLEIRKAFVGECQYKVSMESSSSVVAFGSPIIDFLVMGDESNIISVLNALDVDDKVTAQNAATGLLTSVDKGRPAQAVSTWVQCEHPTCMKWRKIPWYVDPDVLPEQFYCEDNKWNPLASSCDAPEDDWDGDDAMVGSDGKVEGSPLSKRKFSESLPVNEESSFRIGARFDVQRSDKDVFSVASVVKVDFSGSVKRIMFHFAKTSSDRDEWVEFESPRIAPLYTKVSKRRKKASDSKVPHSSSETAKTFPKSGPPTALSCVNGLNGDSACKESNPLNAASVKNANPIKRKPAADPSDENSFVVGARFDVFRMDKKRFYFAKVQDVDCNGPVKKICFRFTKAKDNHVEWLDFGSPLICPFRSKVVRVERKKKPVENGLNGSKALMIANIQPSPTESHLITNTPLNSNATENQVPKEIPCDKPDVPIPSDENIRYDFATTLASLSSSENKESYCVPQGRSSPVEVPSQSNVAPTEETLPRMPPANVVSNHIDDFVRGSSNIAETYSYGNGARNDVGNGSVDLPLKRIYQRPPDFVTHAPNVSSYSVRVNHGHPPQNGGNANMYGYSMIDDVSSSASVMPSVPPSDWSGLDMLAAVTFDAATSMTSSSCSYANGVTPSSTISGMTASTPCDWSVNNNYPSHHGFSYWPSHQYGSAPPQYVPMPPSRSDGLPFGSMPPSLNDGRSSRPYYGSMHGGVANHDYARQMSSSNNERSNDSRYG